MAVLSENEVHERLGQLDGWERRDDSIVRTFQFEDFSGSVDFVSRITPPAEEMNHHPDLAISWNKVTVTLSTHSEGGLTGNDFALAEQITELA